MHIHSPGRTDGGQHVFGLETNLAVPREWHLAERNAEYLLALLGHDGTVFHIDHAFALGTVGGEHRGGWHRVQKTSHRPGSAGPWPPRPGRWH